MMGAVGVDAEGHKHVLAIREGATENATVVKELLEDLVARRVNGDQKRLFVIHGSKVLHTAINAIFGNQHPVQRCRAHIAVRISRAVETAPAGASANEPGSLGSGMAR